MKFILIFFCYCLIIHPAHAADSLVISSPDHTIRVSIHTKNIVTYTVTVDNKIIIPSSSINLELSDGKKLTDNLSQHSVSNRYVDENIIPAVAIKTRNIPNIYNELLIRFKNSFSIIFRVYDDGVAYRIATSFKDSVKIKNETAIIKFTDGSNVLAAIIHKRNDADIFHTSFEELYQQKSMDSLSDKEVMYSPVVITEGNIKIAVTESDLEDYPGMFLKGTNDFSLASAFAVYPIEEKISEGDFPQAIVTKRADYIAKTLGTRNFPWRMLMIAREDKQLPANDIVYRLARPSKLKDVSWINPGQMHGRMDY